MRATEKQYKAMKRKEKVALEGFPEKRTLQYRSEGSEGGTRQRAGKHESPSTKVLRREQVCV